MSDWLIYFTIFLWLDSQGWMKGYLTWPLVIQGVFRWYCITKKDKLKKDPTRICRIYGAVSQKLGMKMCFQKELKLRNYQTSRLISITLLGLWCLMLLSTIFQLYCDGKFYWWRKPGYHTNTTTIVKLTQLMCKTSYSEY